ALIGPALAVPVGLTVIDPVRTGPARIAVGLTGAVMTGLLLVRATGAVRDYAAGQRRVKHLATHAPPTGLPNRPNLLPAVDGTPVAPDRPLWMFFLDLDGFKLVNDSWGHEAGDRLIVEVAHRLSDTLSPDPARRPAARVARVGGDEFLVVFSGSRSDAVELV